MEYFKCIAVEEDTIEGMGEAYIVQRMGPQYRGLWTPQVEEKRRWSEEWLKINCWKDKTWPVVRRIHDAETGSKTIESYIMVSSIKGISKINKEAKSDKSLLSIAWQIKSLSRNREVSGKRRYYRDTKSRD